MTGVQTCALPISRSYPGTGTTWTDLSGNGNNGTLTNGTLYNSSNKGSMSFDGVDDCVVIQNSSSLLSKNNYTKMAWFYATAYNSNNIISSDNGGHAFWLAGGNKLNAGHNGIWSRIYSTTTILLNQWYFGAVTFSNTSGWCLYLNGVLEATNADTSTWSTDTNINIGSYIPGQNVFTGNISNIGIYNRVLTLTEINKNFNALRGRYGI